jgi:hypothetical protein
VGNEFLRFCSFLSLGFENFLGIKGQVVVFEEETWNGVDGARS